MLIIPLIIVILYDDRYTSELISMFYENIDLSMIRLWSGLQKNYADKSYCILSTLKEKESALLVSGKSQPMAREAKTSCPDNTSPSILLSAFWHDVDNDSLVIVPNLHDACYQKVLSLI